jgi:hypothetical protein
MAVRNVKGCVSLNNIIIEEKYRNTARYGFSERRKKVLFTEGWK